MADTNTSSNEIVLSLISHTNVGKTALARTLLRKDVGEVADRAHVTIVSEAYPLIEADGAIVKLWDTPGFGSNLAKLAKRLRSSNNPVGWILHQVWDRLKDESLWCSQEAIRNIQADADIVVYLVDATQSPKAVGYVDLEMEILDWIGKPVLVYLNQVGQPDPDQIETFEEEWRSHFRDYEVVKSVSTLDAFTRCWVQEHVLLEKAAEYVDPSKRKAAKKLTDAWKDKNLAIFDEAVTAMTELAAFALVDTEPLKSKSLLEKFKSLVASKDRDKELERVQRAMYERLAEKTAKTINELISLHGIDGETAQRLAEASREEFSVNRDVEESLMAAVGGALSGLGGGLAADLISGGMTFGGGAIVGMLLGGTTTYALAKGYNLTQTGQNMVRWTEKQFLNQLKFIIMLYLAVSHFGRGRGHWQDSEHSPAKWQEDVEQAISNNENTWSSLWKMGGATANPAKLEKKLNRELRELLITELENLYPAARDLFR